MQGFDAPGMAPPSAEAAKGQPASPEQQEQYNKFVLMGMSALLSEDFMPKAVQMLKSAPSKSDAMARIGSTIVGRMYDSAKQQGQPIDPTVMVHGGLEIMQQIGEMAQAAGLEDVTDEDIETAYYLAADQLNDVLGAQGAFDAELAAEDEEIGRASCRERV